MAIEMVNTSTNPPYHENDEPNEEIYKQLNNKPKIHIKTQEQHELRVPTDVFMFYEHNPGP